MSADDVVQRRSNLALSFQEIFTAIVRLRFNRQTVNSADSFRDHMRLALRSASQDAAQKGYPPEDVKIAAFAVIAFLDESVLSSGNKVFSGWSRTPFQEELFGLRMGDEAFFQEVQKVLARPDSAETADLLEIFYLCLLLGYRGWYGIGSSGELSAIMDSVRDKIQRVRGSGTPISPQWAVPNEAQANKPSDRWVRRLAFGVAAILVLAVVAYALFWMGLASRASALHAIAG